jgi:hypothetical protein
MHMLNHGAQYVIYTPYIQRIINYKADTEFEYDGKHGAYRPHIIRGPAVCPPSPATAATGTSTAAHDSPPDDACAPPASRHAPLAAPESSRATTRRGKKLNILVKGLKTLISMCHSNDALIRKSHQ